MIYTSYFGNMRKIQKLNPELTNFVSIARFTPNWYQGKVYKNLAPHVSLLEDYKNQKITIEYYTKQYNLDLCEIDPKYIVEKLGDNPIMLCYEKYPDFCHRYLVANWLTKNGYEVKELIYR